MYYTGRLTPVHVFFWCIHHVYSTCLCNAFPTPTHVFQTRGLHMLAPPNSPPIGVYHTCETRVFTWFPHDFFHLVRHTRGTHHTFPRLLHHLVGDTRVTHHNFPRLLHQLVGDTRVTHHTFTWLLHQLVGDTRVTHHTFTWLLHQLVGDTHVTYHTYPRLVHH